MTRFLSRLLATLALLVAFAGSAEAHSQLQKTDPLRESIVGTLPETVALSFSEPVAPLALRWLLPDGNKAETTAEVRGNDLVVASVAGGEGSYLLTWRVASADGHPVTGVLVFAVGAPTRGADPVAPDATPAWLAAAGRFLVTLLLVFATGAVVFDRLVAPLGQGLRRTTAIVSGLTLPAALLALGLHGLDMLGASPAALFGLASWQAATGAPVAQSFGLAAAAALAALLSLRLRSTAFALIAWALAAVSFAASGHAAEAAPRWLAGSALTLHGLALIFWLGALVPLVAGLRTPGAGGLLRRFSAIALPMVTVVLGSGAALTLVQAGSLKALIGSAWGMILAVKLSLVALLLLLALANRLWLTPRLERQPAASAPLRRSLMAEIVLSVAILALASSFRLTPPPRLITAPPPVYLHMHGSEAMADVEISPGQAGQNSVSLSFADGDFAALTPLEVRLRFTDAARGLGPLESRAEKQPDGTWRAGPITLPGVGPWELRLDILITVFEKATLTQEVLLAP